MKNKWQNKNTESLIEALLALKSRDESRRFLRDLLTEEELIEFGNRWRVARMLAGNANYKAIAADTGLSSRTIARISKWLNRGMGGYQLMLRRMNHHTAHTSPSPGVARVDVA